MRRDFARRSATAAHLLHDAGLALAEGDVATRLVLDELDLDLATLATGLVIIVVVVVLGWARTLGTAVGIALDEGTVAIPDVVVGRRRVLVMVGDFGGHAVICCGRGYECLALTVCGRRN